MEWIFTRVQESKDAIKAQQVEVTLQEKYDLMLQHWQSNASARIRLKRYPRVILMRRAIFENDLEGEWDRERQTHL